jgi:hypothetical protein
MIVARGKPLSCWLVILEQHRQAVYDSAKGGSAPWRPTLIIVPPHTVDVWFPEVQRFFSTELEIWRFYETKDKVTNAAIKAPTLPTSDQKLVIWLEENCKPDNQP